VVRSFIGGNGVGLEGDEEKNLNCSKVGAESRISVCTRERERERESDGESCCELRARYPSHQDIIIFFFLLNTIVLFGKHYHTPSFS
jgi:hypothetical protein